MRLSKILSVLNLLALLGGAAAQAQTAPSPAPPRPVIDPEVARRELRLPRLPSKDFEIGVLGGVYSTQDFGAHAVGGVRLGYHITEDVFAEAAIARTQVTDENYRRILPGGLFPGGKANLSYANLSAGWNVLPGEVFFGSRWARTSALYLIGGVGTTHLAGQRRQTLNFGTGLRVFFGDGIAAQVDLRDHVFSLDLLGQRKSTHNLEASAGLAFFF